MAGKPAQARVKIWRGTHYLFYTDYATGKQHRRTCESLGAHNAQQRKELQKQYRAKESTEAAEVIVLGGRVTGDAILNDDISAYLQHCRVRAETRLANPDVRVGLSAKSIINMEGTILHFQNWLIAEDLAAMKSKDLKPDTLSQYLSQLIGETTRLGNRRKRRSAATINLYIRNLKACLRWIKRLKPRRFQDFDALVEQLKPVSGSSKQPVAFAPDELQAFAKAAIAHEDKSRTIKVSRRKHGRKRRAYEQPAASKSVTPVSRLFLLLALTGCRLGEALTLKWEHVDLERGRITIHAGKTGLTRWVLLTGAAEGEIAPRFLKLLAAWYQEFEAIQDRCEDGPNAPQGDDPGYVLPRGDFDAPLFPKTAWQTVNAAADLRRIGPQMLRQSFTSYAASLGIPAAVAAMWQGHSAEVAQKHYLAQVLERVKEVKTFEDAMGLTEIIDGMIDEQSSEPSPRKSGNVRR